MRAPRFRTAPLAWAVLALSLALLLSGGSCVVGTLISPKPKQNELFGYQLVLYTGSLGLALTLVGFTSVFAAELIARHSRNLVPWRVSAIILAVGCLLAIPLSQVAYPLVLLLVPLGLFGLLTCLLLFVPKERQT